MQYSSRDQPNEKYLHVFIQKKTTIRDVQKLTSETEVTGYIQA